MSGDASTFAMTAVISICCLVGSLGGDEGLAGKCASVACFVNAFIGLAWAVGNIRRHRKPRRMRMVEFAMVDVDTGRVVPESVSGWSEQVFTASQDTRESLAKARAECKAHAKLIVDTHEMLGKLLREANDRRHSLLKDSVQPSSAK